MDNKTSGTVGAIIAASALSFAAGRLANFADDPGAPQVHTLELRATRTPSTDGGYDVQFKQTAFGHRTRADGGFKDLGGTSICKMPPDNNCAWVLFTQAANTCKWPEE